MTQRHESTPIQEPGIGGPVDLAGVERYRKHRLLPMFLLLAVMIASVISAAEGWLAWPADFPLHRWLPPSMMAMEGYLCAMFALSIPAGNRAENRLIYLAAAQAAGLGIFAAAGCAALFYVLDPASPPGWRIAVPLLAGYATVLPVTLPPMFLAERRRKRLVRAAEQAQA